MSWDQSRRLAGLFPAIVATLTIAGCTHTGRVQEQDEPAGLEDFDGIVVLAASPGAGIAQGAVLQRDVKICLTKGESLTLLDERGRRLLKGAGCWKPGAGAQVSPAEQGERARPLVMGGSPSLLARFPKGSVIPASTICLAEGETLDLRGTRAHARLTGEQCFDDVAIERELVLAEQRSNEGARVASRSERRVRAGSVRGGAEPEGPIQYFVYHGSKRALERYPRGTRKDKYGEICLIKGESLTLVNRSGGKLTLGEGCDAPLLQEKGKNSGATTLGLGADIGRVGGAAR